MKNKYVVAVSGGVDSMYLANKLANENQAAAFVHINHHTRGDDNIYEQNLVTKLGKKYGVPVFIFDFYYKDGNFQAKAREFRYQKLHEIAKLYNNKIAIAHHLDDQLENAMISPHYIKPTLMQYRIVVDDVAVYRPLIGIRKEQIYNLAKDLKLEYNEDYSNTELKYTRNVIRSKLHEKEFKHSARINYILEQNKLAFTLDKRITSLNKAELNSKSKYYIYAQIYNLIKSYDRNISVKKIHLEEIEKQIDKGKNCKYSLTNCVSLFVGYDKIYMLAKDQKIITNALLKKGENEFNGIKFESRFSQGKIRTWQPGDKVEIINGHKKVARIFIDNKIDPNLRTCWPIIVDNRDEIIEIPKLWRKNEIN